METRRIGRSGLKASALCLGTMTFGESKTFMKNVTSADDVARRALDAGIDFVDTADMYVAREVGSSMARVAIAWLLAKPEVSSVILGARDVGQLDDNLGAVELKLTPQHVATLDKASEPAWGYPYDFISMRERW